MSALKVQAAGQPVRVLDIGAGSGLLSIMAARCVNPWLGGRGWRGLTQHQHAGGHSCGMIAVYSPSLRPVDVPCVGAVACAAGAVPPLCGPCGCSCPVVGMGLTGRRTVCGGMVCTCSIYILGALLHAHTSAQLPAPQCAAATGRLHCRAGADQVVAVESSRHLAAVAERVIALNGCSRQVSVVHKDGRYLDVGPRPDGAPGDMHAAADMLVFEVRRREDEGAPGSVHCTQYQHCQDKYEFQRQFAACPLTSLLRHGVV